MSALPFVVVCAWCVKAGAVVEPTGVTISHGICGPHAESVRAELRAMREAAAR